MASVINYCQLIFVYYVSLYRDSYGLALPIFIITFLSSIAIKMSYSQHDYTELMTLAELAGIQAVPGVYRILIELLSLQVSPEDIYVLLRQISPLPQQRKRISSTSKQKPAE